MFTLKSADERVRLVKLAPVFASLSESDYGRIAERARTQIFARSELLFMQGHPCQYLTILSSGCVKLTHLTPNGSEVLLGLRAAHDALYLPAVLPSCKHSFTAQATVPGEALIWSLAAFKELMATVPPLMTNLSEILTLELSELQERYYELSVEKVERRLACTLLRLSAKIGNTSTEGCEISLSREELAQMIGTTLFTVSRLLSKWGELGWVVPRREAVLIVKPEKLEFSDSADDKAQDTSGSHRSSRPGLPGHFAQLRHTQAELRRPVGVS